MARRARRNSLHEVETSPDGRYIRFDEKLGSGAFKNVFLCYDTETGQEVPHTAPAQHTQHTTALSRATDSAPAAVAVCAWCQVAWNTVPLDGVPLDEQQRIRGETAILRQLSHPGIISFGNTWESEAQDAIHFTTEIVTSGTLKQYISRVKGIKLKVVKNWSRQLLLALDYLHHLAPPIIHRDLKCDNIFMNGSTGQIRVGDFGLARARHATVVESVLGTPEFIAPELYEQSYNESVDIYAFGMCVLEMITKEYPFEECSNAAQIWRKVSQGIKPLVLHRIEWTEVRLFIEVCISPADMRPTARELLSHPFLQCSHPAMDDRVCPVREKHDVTAAMTAAIPPTASPRPIHRHAAQQLPHLPVAPSPHSQQMVAQLQSASVHTTQNVNVLPSSPQFTGATTQHQRTRSPNDTIQSTNLQPLPLSRHQSHEQQPHQHHQQQQDAALPAAYAALKLNTSASSTSARQPASSSPSPAGSPPQPFIAGAQRSGTARPPSITTQQPHTSTSPAMRTSHHLSTASPSHTHPRSGGLTPNHHLPTPTAALTSHTGAGQSPTPASSYQTSPLPLSAASGTPGGVQSVLVEVDALNEAIASVTLHIGLNLNRKKQIKFPFDFRLDNSHGVAAEMVKVLKLPDASKTELLIAVELESKLDPFRKHYFVSMVGATTAGSTQHSQHHIEPQHLQQQPPQQLVVPNHQHVSQGGSPTNHPPPPPSQPSRHSPLHHGDSTNHLHLSSATPPAHLLPPSQPSSQLQHTVPLSRPNAQLQHAHSPLQPSQSLTLRDTHARTAVAGSVSLPYSSQQPSSSTHGQLMTSTLSRPPTSQQSVLVTSQPPSTSSQQQRNPPLLHTQSLTTPSTVAPPPPAQRCNTMPMQQLGLPDVHAYAAAAVNGVTSDRGKEGIPRSPPSASPSTPTPAQQQQLAASPPHTTRPPQLSDSTAVRRHSIAAASSSSTADLNHLPVLPLTPSSIRNNRRLSQVSFATSGLDLLIDGADIAQSALRRSQSDYSHPHPTISVHYATAAPTSITTAATGGTLHSQHSHGRGESLNKSYSSMTVAQLKERIRAKGGASRLVDCIEKRDLIDCLIQLSPLLSPLPQSPNPLAHPSVPLRDGLQVPSTRVYMNEPPSAPNSRSTSRQSSRPSSPDPLVHSQQPLSRDRERDSDPFAGLFPSAASGNNTNSLRSSHSPPRSAHSPLAAAGRSVSSSQSSHSQHDTPSPLSATSPQFSPHQFSPVQMADPASPNRHSAQRPASNSTSARSSSIRYTSHAATVPAKGFGSPPLTALHSMSAATAASTILPTDPFSRIQLRSGPHSLDNWQDYFSDQADKQATILPPPLDPLDPVDFMQPQQQQAHTDDSVRAAEAARTERKGAAGKAVAAVSTAAAAHRGLVDSPDFDFFDHRTLNGEYHKQP